ncbi:MAG: hypothetical protein F2534_12430 [Actinobacteria bacterium]|nr:hypothetical protein [Actinomycetota bacterium]
MSLWSRRRNLSALARLTPTAPVGGGSAHRPHRPHRARWAAIGAAVAVSLGGGSVLVASASVTSGTRSVYVPITPCRLFDTRPGADNVGPRATPLGAGEAVSFVGRGASGRCAIPTDAIGLQLNVTVLNGTSTSYLTVWATGDSQPLASSLNWRSGDGPIPNAVTTSLSAGGGLSVFNFAGTVDVFADVTGYYADHNFDDRYYTRAQIDAMISGAAGVVGPQGPAGPAGPAGAAGAAGAPGASGPAGVSCSTDTSAQLTASQLGQLRWDLDPGRPLTVGVGAQPRGIAFDGTSIWVTNSDSDDVTKIDPTTGDVIGTYAVGDYPFGIAFDGTSIWVSNRDSASLTQLDVNTGAVVNTISLSPGTSNYGLVWDGTHLWTNHNTFGVLRINPSTEVVSPFSFPGGTGFALGFDGSHIWVPSRQNPVVSRVDIANPADPPVQVTVGSLPYGVAFDGEAVWVANEGSNTVTKITNISAATPATTSLAAGSTPRGVMFDGSCIWVSNYNAGTISRFDIRLNSRVDIPTGTTAVRTMAFDGSSIWLVSGDSASVRRLRN